MQCGTDPDPSHRLEETPAEALSLLADEFERAGDREGRVRTLRFIVQRHPKTRQAEDARVTLQELGAAAEIGEAPAASSSSVAPDPRGSAGPDEAGEAR